MDARLAWLRRERRSAGGSSLPNDSRVLSNFSPPGGPGKSGEKGLLEANSSRLGLNLTITLQFSICTLQIRDIEICIMQKWIFVSGPPGSGGANGVRPRCRDGQPPGVPADGKNLSRIEREADREATSAGVTAATAVDCPFSPQRYRRRLLHLSQGERAEETVFRQALPERMAPLTRNTRQINCG